MIRTLFVCALALSLPGCAAVVPLATALIPLAITSLQEAPVVIGEVEAVRRAAAAPPRDQTPLIEPTDLTP